VSATGSTRDRGGGRRPRNYLAGAERHRLFLRVVPAALVVMLVAGWIERMWLGPRSPPAPAQVDTVLAPTPAEPPLVDGVRIAVQGAAEEPATSRSGPMASAADGIAVGAGPAALARVRDDTLFRSDDEPAWSDLCRSLAAMPEWPPAPDAVRRVSYADLHGQSRALRGKMVGFRGIVHRIVAVDPPASGDGDHPRWQAWIEPESGPATPIVVYFLRLPADMPQAMKMAEEVDVTGYFFKRWAYQATDAIRTAPLVLSLEPRWRPRPKSAPGGHSWGGWGIVTITGLMVATWLGLQVVGSAPRRPPPAPPASWEDVVELPQRSPVWDAAVLPPDDGGAGEPPR